MEPLVPANVDLRDFAFMPIDVHRLLTSETWVLGTGDERAAAMTLWLVSWHQVPAGSLPENDRMLSHLSQAKTWTKVREHALRGWQIADDSRLYHPIVAEKVLEAWLEKLAQRLSSGAGNAKRWNVEFDPKPIEREMQAARVILSTLNPQSRSLSKKRTSGVQSGSKTIPVGNPKVIPTGFPAGSQETGTGTGTGNKEQKNTPVGELFHDIPEQIVRDFKQLRQKLRAPITATAMDGIRREAGKAGLTLSAALTMCCERGWRGFKAEWVTGETTKQPQSANGASVAATRPMP